jgi:hypothetical protein
MFVYPVRFLPSLRGFTRSNPVVFRGQPQRAAPTANRPISGLLRRCTPRNDAEKRQPDTAIKLKNLFCTPTCIVFCQKTRCLY